MFVHIDQSEEFILFLKKVRKKILEKQRILKERGKNTYSECK